MAQGILTMRRFVPPQLQLVTYLRLFDADAERADWQEVAKIVLLIDPEREPDRARLA